MKNHITKTFERMDLKQIRAYLIYGAEQKIHKDIPPYAERLQQATNPIYKRLETLYPEQSALTEATNELSDAISAYQEVYLEIGMKAGAKLLHQLLYSEE